LCTKISQTLPRLLECSPTRRPYWGSRPGWRRSAASQHMCSDCDGSPSVRGQGPLRGRGRGRGRGGGRSRRERGAACAPGGATGRADGADGADRLPAPADAGEATAAQKSKKPRSIAFAKMQPSYRRTRGDEAIATHLYHAFRGTNVCTFVPRISSAPFFCGVIASFYDETEPEPRLLTLSSRLLTLSSRLLTLSSHLVTRSSRLLTLSSRLLTLSSRLNPKPFIARGCTPGLHASSHLDRPASANLACPRLHTLIVRVCTQMERRRMA
jgi:hypothetical protein